MATKESKAQAVFKRVLRSGTGAGSLGMCIRIARACHAGRITAEEAELAQDALQGYMQNLGGGPWFLHDRLRELGLTDLDATQWREYGLAAFYSTWDKRPKPWRKGHRPVAAILKLAVDSGVYPEQKQYMCHAVGAMFDAGEITRQERERTLREIQQYLIAVGAARVVPPLTLLTAMQAGAFRIEDFCEYIGRDLYMNWRDRPMQLAEVREVVQVAMRRREADRAREGAEEE